MSAHARLAAVRAARDALADVLRRVGHEELAEGAQLEVDQHVATVRVLVPIGDEPVNGAAQVYALVAASCPEMGKARVSGAAFHGPAEVGAWERNLPWAWFDLFRFQTAAGVSEVAPRTLAKMLLAAMPPAPAKAA